MTDEIVMLTAAEWRRSIRGMACYTGDDARVDLVEVTELGEAVVECEDGDRWVLSAPQAGATDGTGREGVLEDLGVYQALLDTFAPGGDFVEYGVVEHRFAKENPRLYADLVRTYGHTAIESRRFTVSSLLAGALSLLERDGSLDRESGRATGRWDYNGQVSYWALLPTPASGRTTWEEFAAEDRIDPWTWPATEGLQGPADSA